MGGYVCAVSGWVCECVISGQVCECAVSERV